MTSKNGCVFSERLIWNLLGSACKGGLFFVVSLEGSWCSCKLENVQQQNELSGSN